MIVVGGVTRLTGSGLSMVEWRPLMGFLPPLSDSEWTRVFEIYKESPQYRTVNHWMTLMDFKRIFFWEYVHRLFGRLIGLVFFLPMAILWLRGKLSVSDKRRGMIAFVLGGTQGALGWYMVKSGLVDIPAVSHYRLAAHLSLAFFLGSFILWWILDRRTVARTQPYPRKRLKYFLGLLGIQIVYGAFMAGTRAGFMYDTFPTLNGALLPASAWVSDLGLENLVNNYDLINVIHRWLAIGLGVGGCALAVSILRSTTFDRGLKSAAQLFLGVLITQVVLGIITVHYRIPVSLGAAHQILAFLLLSAALRLHHAHHRT